MIDQIAADLKELQYRRKFYIKRTNMTVNAMRALVRRALGWQWDMAEKERATLNKRAASIVSALMAGNPVKPEDQDAAEMVVWDVEQVRHAMSGFADASAAIDKNMEKLARSLPAWEWAQGVRGFGAKGLAVVVGEAGDLTNYAGPAKVWKRLGLAPYDGHAPSTWLRQTWRPRALTADEWTEVGYSPARLGQVFGCISEPLLKGQSGQVDDETGEVKREPGPYRLIYDEAKAKFLAAEKGKQHAHAHGLRVMTKALIRDLWRVWHGQAPRQREATFKLAPIPRVLPAAAHQIAAE